MTLVYHLRLKTPYCFRVLINFFSQIRATTSTSANVIPWSRRFHRAIQNALLMVMGGYPMILEVSLINR